MMRNVMWLLLAIVASACATTQQQDPLAAQHAQAAHLGAEMHQSFALVPAPPDFLTWAPPYATREQKLQAWSGFVLIGNDSDGTQAIALPVGDDGIITPAVIAEGEKLPRQPVENGWRFLVSGSVIFQAVLVSKDGHVAGTIDFGAIDTAYTDTKVMVGAYRLKVNNGMRLCTRGLCGELYKLAAEKLIRCEGRRCDDLFQQYTPQQQRDRSL